MHNYVKSVIFALILALAAWDIIPCSGIDSQSFIQQESNPQPKTGIVPVQPVAVTATSTHKPVNPHLQQSFNRGLVPSNNRDYVNLNLPATQIDFPAQLPKQPNSPSRDYVNPNIPPSNTPKIQNTPSRDYVNPNIPSPNTPKIQNTPSRDYVNPNIPSPNTPKIQNTPSRDYVNPNHPPNKNANNHDVISHGGVPPNSKTRDYVAPGYPTLPKTTTQVNVPTQTPKQPNSPKRDYVNPNLPSPNTHKIQNTPNRDYINPNNPSNNRDVISHGGVPPNSKTRDYVAPGYPALPNTGLTTSTSKPLISWAEKVSGGVTTKSPPVVTSKPSPGAPITQKSPTTKRPDDGPSDVELGEFSEVLLRRDVNNAAKYITANVQGKTTSQSKNDQAPQKLLQIQSAAYAIPTIAKIKLLHNNYLLDTNENEYVTAQEKNEENELLDAMLTTPIMQYTRNFLVANGKLAKDPKEFKNLLKVLWFNMYSRGGGRIGSSGFEHIFLAELKKNEVSGLHNWVYFDQAENGNAVDYLGYMKMIDLGDKGSILKFHFNLKGVDKPVGSMFIGTSPELEMALYTTCYLFRADRVCPLKLNGKHLVIRTYNFRYRGKNMIGSAFPEI